eukprot:1348728-Amorphochlora_amoeboformis.AAC.1
MARRTTSGSPCRRRNTPFKYKRSTALAARAAGESKEVVIAALLHDVGHLLGLEAGFEPAMDGCGTVDHEGIGHDFLLDLGSFCFNPAKQI